MDIPLKSLLIVGLYLCLMVTWAVVCHLRISGCCALVFLFLLVLSHHLTNFPTCLSVNDLSTQSAGPSKAQG